jgi:hypothetical protein
MHVTFYMASESGGMNKSSDLKNNPLDLFLLQSGTDLWENKFMKQELLNEIHIKYKLLLNCPIQSRSHIGPQISATYLLCHNSIRKLHNGLISCTQFTNNSACIGRTGMKMRLKLNRSETVSLV